MKIVIEGTKDEVAHAINELSKVFPLRAVGDSSGASFVEFVKLYAPCKHGTPGDQECLFCAAEHDASNLPCPHQRPSWRMCPHCNGVNDHARVVHPAFPPAPPVGELVWPPTSTSEPVATLELPEGVTMAPQGAPIYFKRINEIGLNLTFGTPCPHLHIGLDGGCLDCAVPLTKADV